MSEKLFQKKEYYELDITKVIDRDTKEGEQAWKDLTDHHAIPYVKEGRYPLSQFWLGYSDNPYENLKYAKEDYKDSELKWEDSCMGMLGKVVADYILKEDPEFNEWDNVLLYVTW